MKGNAFAEFLQNMFDYLEVDTGIDIIMELKRIFVHKGIKESIKKIDLKINEYMRKEIGTRDQKTPDPPKKLNLTDLEKNPG